MDLDKKLEAILFWKGEPMEIKELAKVAEASHEDVVGALMILEKKLEGRGVQLARKDSEVALTTLSAAGPLIETLTKEELSKEIGKAGLETIAIILYLGPVSKKDIEYIRGVNCGFILRALLMRGLIERVPSAENQRILLYRPTFDLLSYMSLNKIEELPEYKAFREEIERYKLAHEGEENASEKAA